MWNWIRSLFSFYFASVSDQMLCPAQEISFKFLGQTILLSDFREAKENEFLRIRDEIKSGSPDIVFTDLELAIQGSYQGKEIREGLDSRHVAPPQVLDLLKGLGINFLVNSNNHAYDLGQGGILSTIEEIKKRNLTYAGIGNNIHSASEPGFLRISRNNKTVGASAAVSAPTLETFGGIADQTHPGVNSLQLKVLNSHLKPDDLKRNIQAIQSAASKSDFVIAYHHNHFFETEAGQIDEMKIGRWWSEWAHRAIDAGADIYISHGSTLLHGIEIYKGKPVFYGLGSFFFQTAKPDAYGSESWQSVIVEACWDPKLSKFKMLRLKPILLNSPSHIPIARKSDQPIGLPRLADKEEAAEILKRIRYFSTAKIELREEDSVGYVFID